MEIPNKIMEIITEKCQNVVDNYKKPDKRFIDIEGIEDKVKKLYELEGQKVNKITWLSDIFTVWEIVQGLDSPWVYHHKSNMPWVLFYKTFYETCLKMEEESCKYFVNEGKETYERISLLKDILDYVDGVTELSKEKGEICLVRVDISLINDIDIKKITLN